MPFFFNTSNNSSLYNKIPSCENNGTATQMEKIKINENVKRWITRKLWQLT